MAGETRKRLLVTLFTEEILMHGRKKQPDKATKIQVDAVQQERKNKLCHRGIHESQTMTNFVAKE